MIENNNDLLNNHKKDTLTKVKLFELISQYQKTKSIKTRNIIIEHNIGLLQKISSEVIKAFNTKFITQEELISEGVYGMIRAIEKFDTSLDLKFSTYAFIWIKQSMQKYILNNESLIRVPINSQTEAYNIQKNDIDLINDRIKERILSVKNAKMGIESIDDDESETSPMINLIAKDNLETNYANNEIKDKIRTLLDSLTENQKKVIIYRFGLFNNEYRTFTEVATLLNLSRERIRQIEMVAIKKLSIIMNQDSTAYGKNNYQDSKELDVASNIPSMLSIKSKLKIPDLYKAS